MSMLLASNWWAVALRGVCGIVFGILAFLRPGAAVAALVLVFGVYAFLDGVFAVTAAVRTRQGDSRWGTLLFVGLVGIVAGVFTFLEPAIAALYLVFVVATWAVITGVLEIVAAVRLRRTIRHEWLLALGGALSIAFGILLWWAPIFGAVVLTLWIGAYLLVDGVVQLGLAFRLRHWQHTAAQGTEPLAA